MVDDFGDDVVYTMAGYGHRVTVCKLRHSISNFSVVRGWCEEGQNFHNDKVVVCIDVDAFSRDSG